MRTGVDDGGRTVDRQKLPAARPSTRSPERRRHLPGMLTAGSIQPRSRQHRQDRRRRRRRCRVAAVITYDDVPNGVHRSVMAGATPCDRRGEPGPVRHLGKAATWAMGRRRPRSIPAESSTYQVDMSAPGGLRSRRGPQTRAPVIHEDWPDNVAGVSTPLQSRGYRTGAESDVVVSSPADLTPKQAHLEPDVAVASWGDDGPHHLVPKPERIWPSVAWGARSSASTRATCAGHDGRRRRVGAAQSVWNPWRPCWRV